MTNRSLALALATLASMHIGSAEAQSVYVAPGGVYIAGGPVYVTPAPDNGAPYVAPTNGFGYRPPAVVAPPPVAPTAYYAPAAGYYHAPVLAYGAEYAPRPPLPVPYYGIGRCAYSRCY